MTSKFNKTKRFLQGVALSAILVANAVSADGLRFWTTEDQPDRLAKQQAMAADFKAKTGIEVEVIPVSEKDLGTRTTAAYAAGDLPDIIYHHLPPETWGGLLGQMYRNGYQAAYANLHSPEWVIETPAEHGDFTLRVPLWKRILRYPLRMLKSLFSGQWLWVICQTWYAVGFVRGWLTEKGKKA